MTAVPPPVVCGLAGLFALAAVDVASDRALADQPLLVVNESPSLRRGVYVREPGASLRRGAFVVTSPPATACSYLGALGIRPEARLLKRLAAVPGDRICAVGGATHAAGHRVPVFASDRAGRSLPRWRGCRTLGAGEVFLLGDTPQSFDSRYFGPVPINVVEGPYREVLTW